jgi:hypothetical protein
MAEATADLGARIVQATRLAVAEHLQQALGAFGTDADVTQWRQRLRRQGLHSAGGAGTLGAQRELSGAAPADLTDEALSMDVEACPPQVTTRAAGMAPRLSSLWRRPPGGRRRNADGGAG